MNDAAHDFERLIEALLDPRVYPHPVDAVETIETHISTVLLAGGYAYKLKKPVDLGFVNFTDLDDRKFYCEEEIRLNSRLAPSVYLDVAPVYGTPEAPSFQGAGQPIEYAVKMRRFPQDALLDRRIEDATLPPSVVDEIGDRVARFHQNIARAGPDSGWGTPAAVLAPMSENFEHLRRIARTNRILAQTERIESWVRECHRRLGPELSHRRDHGFIRECHGDMHLGNMALVDDAVAVFDGIEFNPGLRWIDVISEIAFLVMDFDHRDAPGLGWRFLNRYLTHTGDYRGLRLLRFYQCYRAMVRAKVDGIRSTQDHLPESRRQRIIDDCRVLLDLAETYTQPGTPGLLLTCGLSGSGKTTQAAALAERSGMIHIRSDVERRRLFGLDLQTPSGSNLGGNIYTASATASVYSHLEAIARDLLNEGFMVIVDATFLKRDQRRPFLAMADALQVPARILWLQAPAEILRDRIRARQAAGTDPSEADLEVLEHQLGVIEPPEPPEPVLTAPAEGDLDGAVDRIEAALRAGHRPVIR